jgi:aryl-alcohol dehydrogenase-like predicted oxidoreductase
VTGSRSRRSSGYALARTGPGDNARTNAALLEPVKAIAAAHKATLAWLRQQGARHRTAVVPIPGTKKRSRIEENVGATRLVLNGEELAALEPIASRVCGSRHATSVTAR